MKNTAIDPIRLEVLKNAFDTIADEMALILMRTAYSAIVRDSMDYSTAICDAQGRTLAQGLTTPLHLGSFYDALTYLIGEYGGRVDPGDVFIGNDPYVAGGQHLPDIYIVWPVFAEGTLQGWATTLAHHADVGGIIPGSNALGAVEIYQEGLRLPFLKLYEKGCRNDALWRVIETNVRIPELVMGDLEAQIVGARTGAAKFGALVEQNGSETLGRYIEALHDYAETLARGEIAEIPDGTYRFTDYIDGLGENPVPIALSVSITVRGDEIDVDWEGTSPQVRGGINAPMPFTKAAAHTAIRSVMKSDVPNCHGYTRPIRVMAPAGSLVNPVSPAACGARGITGFRMVDSMFGALAKALPRAVAADGSGGSTLPTFAGTYNGRPFVFSETLMGNWGGTDQGDGQEGVAHMGANQSNVPIELIELDYPIRVEQYGFVPDTGGPGRSRGGVSIIRDYRILEDDVLLSVRSDKRSHPPHGLFSGDDGAPSMNIVNPGEATQRTLPVLMIHPISLSRGDLFRHLMAGAGGYGPAHERDPGLVLEDVILEKVSIGQAAAAYGVIITAGSPPLVDREATRKMRRSRVATAAPDWRKGELMRAADHRLVLRNGLIVDGTGGPAVKADVLVEGPLIGAIGFPETGCDAEEIDVGGLVVAPGFIDIHSHSDFTLLRDPRAVSQISQGVTTEVVGNCGYGCCPICDPKFACEAIYGYDSSVDMDWKDLDGYFRRLESAGPAVNVASLVPNGQLRIGVLGGASRPAAADEIRRMALLLQENLEQGAFGFSTGLEYPWESSASAEEITALCKVVARHGGIYATHTRDRGARALEAIDEALDTARAAQVPLQISHIVPRRGRDDTERAIARVDQALARGQDVAFDMHTRLFGTTFLKVLLPASELRLPRDILVRRLADVTVMKEILAYRSLISSVGDWSRVELFKAPARPELEGKTFDEIGGRMGCDPHRAAIAILLAHAGDLNGPMVLLHTYDEETLRLAYSHDSCTIGSDATALAPDGPLSASQFHGAYSWASWFYRRIVRETATLTMEDAIHRLSHQPAQRVGIAGRGLLKPGFAADIAVFDPQVFGETAKTYDPNRLAVGMRHVLVNGRLALRDGIETGNRNGRVLRKNGR